MSDEYISREAAIDDLTHTLFYDQRDKATAKTVIATLPAADLKPIVRCKDCKHAMMTSDGTSCKWCCHWNSIYDDNTEPLYLPADFFCAAGERRK